MIQTRITAFYPLDVEGIIWDDTLSMTIYHKNGRHHWCCPWCLRPTNDYPCRHCTGGSVHDLASKIHNYARAKRDYETLAYSECLGLLDVIEDMGIWEMLNWLEACDQ